MAQLTACPHLEGVKLVRALASPEVLIKDYVLGFWRLGRSVVVW